MFGSAWVVSQLFITGHLLLEASWKCFCAVILKGLVVHFTILNSSLPCQIKTAYESCVSLSATGFYRWVKIHTAEALTRFHGLHPGKFWEDVQAPSPLSLLQIKAAFPFLPTSEKLRLTISWLGTVDSWWSTALRTSKSGVDLTSFQLTLVWRGINEIRALPGALLCVSLVT